MNALGRSLLILALAAPLAHAQEDDDDPKAAARHPAAKTAKPATPAKPAAPAAAPAPAAAKTPAAVPPVTHKAAAEPAAAAKKPSAEAAAPAPAAAPTKKTPDAVAHKTEPKEAAAPVARKPPPDDVPTPRKPMRAGSGSDDDLPPTPRKLPTPPAETKASAPLAVEPAASARPVRVRLVDGSTVVGSVRAEEREALVIDCALGQLAIPRGRISTIAYDAAAGVAQGQKKAPVQILDDGDTVPRKK